MGTRSLTRIFNDGQEIACIYQQFDGYPSGVGAELAEFLKSGRFVNGIPSGEEGRMFNGMVCFAAQLVAHLKTHAGGAYLYAPGSSDVGEEYVYEISGGLRSEGEWMGKPQPIKVKVIAYDKPAFEGDIDGFVEFCGADHDADEEAA